MRRLPKHPMITEARQLDGNIDQLILWLQAYGVGYRVDSHPTDRTKDVLHITTSKGMTRAEPGDWIIKNVSDNFYIYKSYA